MSTQVWTKRLFALAILAGGVSSEAAAQASAADPWQKVPTATSCFTDDNFRDRLHAAMAELDADLVRQNELNKELKSKFDAMDGSERGLRMQAFMMKNPQQFTKILQAQHAVTTTVAADITSATEASLRLQAELARDQASYKTAIDNAVRPVQARQKQLIDAKTVVIGHASSPEFTAAADHAQYVALINQENTEHQRACAPYFGAGGKFVTWLSNYKTEVAEKLVLTPEAEDAALAMQLAIMETSAGSYRSTAKLQAVRNYLDMVARVYNVRPNKSLPRVELVKR